MSPSQESPPLPRPLKALLVDDEPVAIERFRMLLAPHAEIEVVATATSAAAARARLITPCTPEFPGPIDVVFLDVEMPGETGIAVLPSVPKETVVVFVTAFPQYAIQAFQVGAIDYLLKPIDPERLEQTIDRIVKLVPLLRAEPGDEYDDDSAYPVDSSGKHAPLASTATLRVPLVGGGGIQEVRIGTICWIEGMRNYSRCAIPSGSIFSAAVSPTGRAICPRRCSRGFQNRSLSTRRSCPRANGGRATRRSSPSPDARMPSRSAGSPPSASARSSARWSDPWKKSSKTFFPLVARRKSQGFPGLRPPHPAADHDSNSVLSMPDCRIIDRNVPRFSSSCIGTGTVTVPASSVFCMAT